MKQAEVFFKSEGTAWLKRNTKKVPIKDDLILAALGELVGDLGRVIAEVGCSNGWRLQEIKKRYKCDLVTGIDPSASAIAEAKKKNHVYGAARGFAHSLPWANSSIDTLIYGFCLYVCDRESLFAIVKEGDRVLRDGGLLVIYDFATPRPCKNKYHHKDGMWSYKQDYEAMFLASPAYTKILSKFHKDGQTKAVVMRKLVEQGWPECE